MIPFQVHLVHCRCGGKLCRRYVGAYFLGIIYVIALDKRGAISYYRDMENTLTAGTRIEVKVLPFDPPHSGIVHDNQDGVMPGKVRVFLDARPGLAEASRMTSVKISAVKVIA